jgi:hypothetical protein
MDKFYSSDDNSNDDNSNDDNSHDDNSHDDNEDIINSDDDISQDNYDYKFICDYKPNIKFQNKSEQIITNIITKDKLEGDELKEYLKYYSHFDPQKTFNLYDTIWCITNYGRFIKYSNMKQEYETYYALPHWNIYCDDYVDFKNSKFTKIEYKLPKLFIKLLNGFVNKDSDKIQECCKIFHYDYDTIVKSTNNIDVIKENILLKEKNTLNKNKIKELEQQIKHLQSDNLYKENTSLKNDKDNYKKQIDELKLENNTLKNQLNTKTNEYNTLFTKFTELNNAIRILKGLFN